MPNDSINVIDSIFNLVKDPSNDVTTNSLKEGIAVAQNEKHIKPVLIVLAESPYALGNGNYNRLGTAGFGIEKMWNYISTVKSENPDASLKDISNTTWELMKSEHKWLTGDEWNEQKQYAREILTNLVYTFQGESGQHYYDKWRKSLSLQERDFHDIGDIVGDVLRLQKKHIGKRMKFFKSMSDFDSQNPSDEVKSLRNEYQDIKRIADFFNTSQKIYVLPGESKEDFKTRMVSMVDKAFHEDKLPNDILDYKRGNSSVPWQKELDTKLSNYWDSSKNVNKINLFNNNFSYQGRNVLEPRLSAAGYEVVTLPIYGESSMDNANDFIISEYEGRDIEIAVLGHSGNAFAGEEYGYETIMRSVLTPSIKSDTHQLSDELKVLKGIDVDSTSYDYAALNTKIHEIAEVSSDPFMWQVTFNDVKEKCNVTSVYLGACNMGGWPIETSIMGDVFGASAYGWADKWGTKNLTKNPKNALEAMFHIEKNGVNVPGSRINDGDNWSEWSESHADENYFDAGVRAHMPFSGGKSVSEDMSVVKDLNGGFLTKLTINTNTISNDKKTLGIDLESALEAIDTLTKWEDATLERIRNQPPTLGIQPKVK